MNGFIALKDKTIELANIVIMKPGTWNGLEYRANEIKKAFEKMPEKLLIFEDFKESIEHLIGIAKNFRLEEDTIIADIEIHKKVPAIDLKVGGIMPKISASSTKEKVIEDFEFENLSLVLNPAIK